MLTLFHHRLLSIFAPSVVSRSAANGVEVCLVEERPWVRRDESLVMNTEGTTPAWLSYGAPANSGRVD